MSDSTPVEAVLIGMLQLIKNKPGMTPFEQTLRAENDTLKERITLLEEALVGAPFRFPLEWKLTRSHEIILKVLVKNKVASRPMIDSVLYSGRVKDWPSLKTLDVLMFQLRRKLKPIGLEIVTYRNKGWALTPASKEKLNGLR